MIQKLNSYNLSTNKKGLKKLLAQFADQIKKVRKSTGKLELKLSINTLLYKQCLCILTLPKCNA